MAIKVSLDYDLLSYKLANLSCGSVYSFNLVAHNIAGRSKPRLVFFVINISSQSLTSLYCAFIIITIIMLEILLSATITTPTLGSAPEQLTNQRIISGEF